MSYDEDQTWLHEPVLTETTRSRIIQMREYAVERRNFAQKLLKLVRENELAGKLEEADRLREHARVVDAEAMGVETTLSALFDPLEKD